MRLIDRYSQLDSCISHGNVHTEGLISIHYFKAFVVSAWRPVIDHTAAIRSILLYGSEKYPLRAENLRKTLVFKHRFLLALVECGYRI